MLYLRKIVNYYTKFTIYRVKEIAVILTPPRPEIIPDLEEVVKNFKTFIIEIPEISTFRDFLEDRVPVDEVLMDLELEYPLFTREFLLMCKRLYKNGIDILPLDPYQEIATNIKVKLFFRKGLEELDRDLTARYIAMIELNLGKVFQEYSRAFSRRDFDKLIETTMKYAKLDAERMRFRTELRIRKLCEIYSRLRKPVAVHTHFINRLLPREIERRLNVEVEVIDLYKDIISKLGLEEFDHPGRVLTEKYLLHDIHNVEELKILAAKTIILVSQYPPRELMPTREERYPMLMKDYEIMKIIGKIDKLEDLKTIYEKMSRKPATHR